jgi:hypothetical protein
MFGNPFIDYCFINFDNLVKLSGENNPDRIAVASPEARMFLKFYQYICIKKGITVPFDELLKFGIDMQTICLLSFLIGFKEQPISCTAKGVKFG